MDLDIQLDRSSGVLLSHQIGRAILDLIDGGALRPGAMLPATRTLAQHLSVARMTVVEAYEWLAEQGHVAPRRGAGTVVQAPAAQPVATSRPARPAPATADQIQIDFRPGVPSLASFPRKRWKAALAASCDALPVDQLGYGDPLGHAPLRAAIAGYLHRSRSLRVAAENVVITAGAAQAIDLLVRVTLPRRLLTESPGPSAQRELAALHGLQLQEIEVDRDGLRVDKLPRRAMQDALLFVIPSHQFPAGCVLSAERRQALLAWAAETGARIIEDDYDSEFAFEGRAAVPLARLDRGGSVIYAGTFSKTLAPALRLGFLVVPDALLPRIAALKWWIDRGGSTIEQAALARWIEDGTFERHVQRMRRIYRDRHVLLASVLRDQLGTRVRFIGERRGLHATVLVQSDRGTAEIVRRAAARGVRLYPLWGRLEAAEAGEVGFVFGFGNLTASEIRRGAMLAAAAM